MALAIDGGFESARNALSAYNGDAWRLGAVVEVERRAHRGDHLLELGALLDERWLAMPAQVGQGFPLQKARDELGADMQYTRLLTERVGPYARVMARTALFNTYLYPDRPTRFDYVKEDGSVQRIRNYDREHQVRLMQRFAPLHVGEEAGLSVLLMDDQGVASVAARAGLGARHALYRDAAFVREVSDSQVTLEVLEDKPVLWGSALGATARLNFRERGAALRVDFEGLVVHNQIVDSERPWRPLYRLDLLATMALGRRVELAYSITFRRDDLQIKALQMNQGLALRVIFERERHRAR